MSEDSSKYADAKEHDAAMQRDGAIILESDNWGKAETYYRKDKCELIAADALLKRWQGIRSEELALICLHYSYFGKAAIGSYYLTIPEKHNGIYRKSLFANRLGLFAFQKFKRKPYDFCGLYFILDDVKEFEQDNKWVLERKGDYKNISCEHIRLLCGQSRLDAASFLHHQKLLTFDTSYQDKYEEWQYNKPYEDDGYYPPFFNIEMFDNDNFYIERKNLERYLRDAEKGFLDNIKERKEIKGAQAWYDDMQDQLAALQSKNAELKAQIEALEAQLEQAKQSPPEAPETQADVPARGKAGRAVSNENTLARWQAVIPAMLEVWHGIMSAEAKPHTRAIIEKRLREHGKKQAPNRPQLDFFMDCLPSEYKVPQGGSEKK